VYVGVGGTTGAGGVGGVGGTGAFEIPPVAGLIFFPLVVVVAGGVDVPIDIVLDGE
jgi:hypothetical protein